MKETTGHTPIKTQFGFESNRTASKHFGRSRTAGKEGDDQSRTVDGADMRTFGEKHVSRLSSEGTCFACRARLSRRIAGVAWFGELGRACWVGSCRGVPGWLLAIPCLWVACALCRLAGVRTIVAFFTVLFTQRIPRGVFDLMVLEMRGNPRAVHTHIS